MGTPVLLLFECCAELCNHRLEHNATHYVCIRNDNKLGAAGLGLVKTIEIPRFIQGMLNCTALFRLEVIDKSAIAKSAPIRL